MSVNARHVRHLRQIGMISEKHVTPRTVDEPRSEETLGAIRVNIDDLPLIVRRAFPVHQARIYFWIDEGGAADKRVACRARRITLRAYAFFEGF